MKKSRITIYDIAKHAGVSTATVSRFINKSGYVDKETTDKIKKVVDRLGYKPSMAARSLKTKKSRLVILIIPDIENPFYSRMSKYLQKYAGDEGYSLVLFDTNGHEREELKAIDAASQMYASGIIHTSINISDSVLGRLTDADIPTVVANSYGACPFDSVHGDRERSGAYIATEHLIRWGHEKIAFAGGEKNSIIGQTRLSGYMRAMNDAGLALRQDFIRQNTFTQEGGYEAGAYLSGLSSLPTAVCCANDMVALGLMSALKDKGIDVPGDISVTGVDNIPYASLVSPALTTVVNDSAVFASASAAMLFERISESYTGEPREISIPRELIIRQSVKKLTE